MDVTALHLFTAWFPTKSLEWDELPIRKSSTEESTMTVSKPFSQGWQLVYMPPRSLNLVLSMKIQPHFLLVFRVNPCIFRRKREPVLKPHVFWWHRKPGRSCFPPLVKQRLEFWCNLASSALSITWFSATPSLLDAQPAPWLLLSFWKHSPTYHVTLHRSTKQKSAHQISGLHDGNSSCPV